MKRKAESLIYINGSNWSGGRCTAGATTAVVPSPPLHAARSPSRHLISSSALGVGGYCILMANRCLAAVSAPHAPLGEGRPSSRRQQQGRASFESSSGLAAKRQQADQDRYSAATALVISKLTTYALVHLNTKKLFTYHV